MQDLDLGLLAWCFVQAIYAPHTSTDSRTFPRSFRIIFKSIENCPDAVRKSSPKVSRAHWEEGIEKLKLPIATGLLDLRLGDSQDLWEHIKDVSSLSSLIA